MFTLTSDHLTGVPEIDRQHAELIDSCTELFQKDLKKINPGFIFNVVQLHCIQHFQYEEKLLVATNVHIDYHLSLHALFRKKLISLRPLAVAGDARSVLYLRDSLIPELLTHILIDDFVMFAHTPELRTGKT